MKRTIKQNEQEWVYLVQHSETLCYQILDENLRKTRRNPNWISVLLKILKVGKKLYGL